MSLKTKMGSKRKLHGKNESKNSPSSANNQPEAEIADPNTYQVAQGQVFIYLKEKAVGRNEISIKQVREMLTKRQEIYDESKRDFESDLRSLRIEVENYGSKLMNHVSRAIKDHTSKLVNMARKYGDGEFKDFNEVTNSFKSLLQKFEESLFEERRNMGKFAKPQTNSCSYFVNQELYNKFKLDSYEVNIEFVPDEQIVIPFDFVNFGELHFDGRPRDDLVLDDIPNDGIALSDDSDGSIIIETAKKRFYRKKRRRNRSDAEDSDKESEDTFEPCVEILRTTPSAVPVVEEESNISSASSIKIQSTVGSTSDIEEIDMVTKKSSAKKTNGVPLSFGSIFKKSDSQPNSKSKSEKSEPMILNKKESKKNKRLKITKESSVSSLDNDARMSVPSPISAPSIKSNVDSNSVASIDMTENKASECQSVDVIGEADSVACLVVLSKNANFKNKKPTKSEEKCTRVKKKKSKDERDSSKVTANGDEQKRVLKVTEKLVKDKDVSRSKNCEKMAAVFLGKFSKDTKDLVKISADFKLNMEKVFDILSSKIKADEFKALKVLTDSYNKTADAKTKIIKECAKKIDKQAVLSEFKPRDNTKNSVEKTIVKKKSRKGKRSNICLICHEKEPKDRRTKAFIAVCSECNRAFHGSCFVPTLRENIDDDWCCGMCQTKEEFLKVLYEDLKFRSVLKLELRICEFILLNLYAQPSSDKFHLATSNTKGISFSKIRQKLRGFTNYTVINFINDVTSLFSITIKVNKPDDKLVSVTNEMNRKFVELTKQYLSEYMTCAKIEPICAN